MNRNVLRTLLASLFALALLAGCGNGEKAESPQKEQKKVTASDIKKEARETIAAAKDFTFQQKEEYLSRLKSTMEDIDRRIEEIETQAESKAGAMTEQGKAEYRQAMEELGEKRKAAEAKYESLRSSSADAWEDMKSGMSAAIKDLDKAMERAKAHFEG